MLYIVLFGPPGAGKGTQSKKIIEKYKLTHISTGEILRTAIQEKTNLGIEAQKLIDKGYYVTDEMAIDIIKNKMNEHQETNGFIFDGFPRTIHQADVFAQILLERAACVHVMISLEVEENVLIERLSKRSYEYKRIDDQGIEIIKKRIGIYNQRTEQLKGYYQSIGKHESISGIGEKDQIFNNICKIIEKYK